MKYLKEKILWVLQISPIFWKIRCLLYSTLNLLGEAQTRTSQNPTSEWENWDIYINGGFKEITRKTGIRTQGWGRWEGSETVEDGDGGWVAKKKKDRDKDSLMEVGVDG